jgi:hypothetical protein
LSSLFSRIQWRVYFGDGETSQRGILIYNIGAIS